MGLFRSTNVDAGQIVAGSKKVIVWEFDEIKKSDIGVYFEDNKWHYAVFKNCSCQGTVLVSETALTIEYIDKGYKGEVTKELKVYLKNGDMPIRVKNDRGIVDFNPSLGYVMLYFTARIV